MFQGSTDDKATSLYEEFKGAGVSPKVGSEIILSDFSLPLKALTDLASSFKTLIKESESIAAQMDDSITEIVNTMGQGKGLASVMRENIAKAVPEIVKMGGSFEDAEQLAVSTLEALGRNVQLNEKEYEQLYATTRLTGESNEALQNAFADTGKSIKDISKEMFNVVNIANSMGANAKAVSKDVVANMQQLNRLGFEGGINGLAKMASQASILRIDMQQVFDFADQALSPEKAIEFSSALQRLGAASSSLVDPLKLMDLSQNNVPELQNQLGQLFKQYAKFDEKTKQFQIVPGSRLILKELERDLGIPLAQIEKMALSSADLDRKMSQIDLSGLALDDETAMLVTSMAKMGEGGEYVIETKTAEGDPIQESIEEFVSRFEGDSEAIKSFVQDREAEEGLTVDQKILQRAEDQLSTLKSIDQSMKAASMAKALTVGGGELGAQMLKMNEAAVKQITQPAIDTFGPNSGLFKAINLTAKNVDEAVKLLSKGDTSGMGKALKETGKTMALTADYGLDQTFEAGKKTLGFVPGVTTALGVAQVGANAASSLGLSAAGVTSQDQLTFKDQVETKDALISTETDSSIIVVNELGKIGQVLKPAPQDVVGVMPKEGMNQFMQAVESPKIVDKTKEANDYTKLLGTEKTPITQSTTTNNQFNTQNQNLSYLNSMTSNAVNNYETLISSLNNFSENFNKSLSTNFETINAQQLGTEGVTPTINIDLTTKENLKSFSETKKDLLQIKPEVIDKQFSTIEKEKFFEQKEKEKEYKVSEISPKFIEKNKIDETTTSTQNILEKYMSVMSTSSSMNFEGGKIDLNFNHSVKIEGVNELTASQLVGPLKTIFEKNQGGIGNIVQQTLENKLKFGQNQVSSKKTPYFEKPMVSR